jgi:predicted patatin/cPLA2 family phospholipase
MASGAIESIEYATDETYVRLFNWIRTNSYQADRPFIFMELQAEN